MLSRMCISDKHQIIFYYKYVRRHSLLLISNSNLASCILSVNYESGSTFPPCTSLGRTNDSPQQGARIAGVRHKCPYKVVTVLPLKISEYPGCPGPSAHRTLGPHQYLGPFAWPEPPGPTPEAIKRFLRCLGLLKVYCLV